MKENKKIICFLVIGILLGFVAGLLTTNLITSMQTEDTNAEEKKGETQKEVTKSNEGNSKIEEKVIAIDELALKYGVKLNDEEIYDFIHSSSNLSGWQSDNLDGAMFNETISDEYKLFYTLSRIFSSIYNESGSYSGELVSIRKDTIEQLAKQIFADFKFPEKITKDAWYAGTHDVICDDTKCVFIANTFSILGPAQSGYEGPITKEDNKYIVKPICVEFENDKYLDNEDDVLADIILKDKHNGKTIKILKQQKLNSLENKEDERNLYYNALSKYYTNIETYTYEFNEENVLLSVKKS